MKPEELTTRTAYAVTGYNGLFLYRHTNPESGLASMIRIDHENYLIDVTPEQIQPAEEYQIPAENLLTCFALCAEAIQRYHLDPARVLRAAVIANTRGMIGNARKDENGEPIPTTPNVKYVRGSKGGFYTVRRQACTCKDHENGFICKHRIASWIVDETYLRHTAHFTGQSREKIAAIYYSYPSAGEIPETARVNKNATA